MNQCTCNTDGPPLLHDEDCPVRLSAFGADPAWGPGEPGEVRTTEDASFRYDDTWAVELDEEDERTYYAQDDAPLEERSLDTDADSASLDTSLFEGDFIVIHQTPHGPLSHTKRGPTITFPLYKQKRPGRHQEMERARQIFKDHFLVFYYNFTNKQGLSNLVMVLEPAPIVEWPES